MHCEAKPLSHGWATRAGSVTNPRAWAYSNQPTLNCGLSESALGTTGVILSGISTLNTPPKNRHAASQPAMIASSVWENVNHTNMCREYTAVKISACTTRRRPESVSKIIPIRAKSI